MATFFGSPPFVSHPIVRTQHLSSSSQPPPPPPLPPLPPSQPPSQQPSLSKRSPELQPPLPVAASERGGKAKGTSVDSTDWIASSLTRRFGLGAGLAWAGFLAFGVVSEQIKTRLEVAQQETNTRDVEKEEEVVLPNGIRYYEMRVGGGATPKKGDLVVIDIKGNVAGDGVFVDTFGKDKKPLALVVGSRPFSKGMCEGVEMVLKSMKNGGKRRVIVPHALGFGDEGVDFGSGFKIPPSATLEYILVVEKVSIAPS